MSTINTVIDKDFGIINRDENGQWTELTNSVIFRDDEIAEMIACGEAVEL